MKSTHSESIVSIILNLVLIVLCFAITIAEATRPAPDDWVAALLVSCALLVGTVTGAFKV